MQPNAFLDFTRLRSALRPRAWLQDAAARLNLLFLAWCLATVVTVLLSYRLWLDHRAFPLLPAVPVPVWPFPLDLLRLLALVLLPVIALLAAHPRPWLLAFAAIAALTALGDYSRLQPWWIQFTCTALLLAHSFAKKAPAPETGALVPYRLILSGIYLWAGIHKLNPDFISHVFPWMAEPFANWPAPVPGIMTWAGYAVAPVEMFIGITLWLPWLRIPAILLALFTHAFILGVIGPWAHNWNFTVWPWNLYMCAAVLLLFAGKWEFPRVRSAWLNLRTAAIAFIFLLFPASHISGWGDAYLCISLYSGKVDEGRILLSAESEKMLPPEARKHVAWVEGYPELWPDLWAIEVTGVPIYPEGRVFRQLAVEMTASWPDSLREQIRMESALWNHGDWKWVSWDGFGRAAK